MQNVAVSWPVVLIQTWLLLAYTEMYEKQEFVVDNSGCDCSGGNLVGAVQTGSGRAYGSASTGNNWR